LALKKSAGISNEKSSKERKAKQQKLANKSTRRKSSDEISSSTAMPIFSTTSKMMAKTKNLIEERKRSASKEIQPKAGRKFIKNNIIKINQNSRLPKFT
jgi:hypothetical protein